MDSSSVKFIVWLSLLQLAFTARVSIPSSEEISEDDDDSDYLQDMPTSDIENYIEKLSSRQQNVKKEKHNEFNKFLEAATRDEDKPKAIFLRPLPRFDSRSSEERLRAAAQSRALFFHGSPRGRRVPLRTDHLLQDKCQTLPFDFVVSHQGCENSTVRSHFCYGLCSSLFVPLHDDVISTCNTCAPTEFQNVAIQLKCPDREHNLRKHVKVVTSCGCVGCDTKGGIFG